MSPARAGTAPASDTPPIEPRRIEAALPRRFRGRGGGYDRMLEGIPLRVSVAGTRGKSFLVRRLDEALRRRGRSTYAKVTGTEAVSYKAGTAYPIRRGDGPVRLDENVWELKRFFPMDAAVMENQGTSEYTMRVFHTAILRPHYVLVPNVRLDHFDHHDRERAARAHGRTVSPGATVLVAEPDPALREAFQEAAERRGATVVPTPPPGGDRCPGLGHLELLDALLDEAVGEPLRHGERSHLRAELEAHFSWQPSSRAGLRWFPGASCNDVDSTTEALAYLQRRSAMPVTFVAYLRTDRRARSRRFAELLQELLDCGEAEHVHLVGPGAPVVHGWLDDPDDRVHQFPDDPDAVRVLIDRVRARTVGGRVMTLANATPLFMRRLEQALAPPGERTATAGEATPRTIAATVS